MHRAGSDNYISNDLPNDFDLAYLKIKNNTKKGYLEAYEGDGVYTNPTTKRGTVQHEMIQTLTTFQDKGVVVGSKK